MTEALTTIDTLVAAARTSRGLRVIEYDGQVTELRYRDLLTDALRIGGALQAHGLRPGARVALVIPEVGNFVQAFFGVSAAGLVPVPLFPPAQASDLPTFRRQTRHLIAASRAAAVLTTTDVTPLLGNVDGADDLPSTKVLTLNTLAGSPPLDTPVAVSPRQVALIQFTSGSTAAPKGVMLTHEELYANVSSIAGPEGLDLGADDVGVSWLPLYHDMGLIGMLLTPVFVRADSVVMSPVLFLKRPSAWLSAISTYRATVSFAPSFAYELCLRRVKRSQVDALDLSSWRIAGCGAEPVRIDTLRAFAEQFGPAGFRASSFRPSYGLAEHTLAVSFSTGLRVDTIDAGHFIGESRALPVNGTHGGPAMRIASCGRPFSDHAVRIVDEAGHALPERRVGRIVARGASVMAGYFEDAEATNETLLDGWLQTGDLGYIADGELYVCGRTKDLIIRNGRKYHPPDLESAIATVDGLRPSGVVVFAINRVEEADEVVAVLEARQSSTSSDLADHVRRRVRETSGLELDRVVVAPPGTIPRTTSGKVRRAETRERLEAGTLLGSNRDAVIHGSLQ